MAEVRVRYIIEFKRSVESDDPWEYWDDSTDRETVFLMVEEWRKMRREYQFRVRLKRTVIFKEVTCEPHDSPFHNFPR